MKNKWRKIFFVAIPLTIIIWVAAIALIVMPGDSSVQQTALPTLVALDDNTVQTGAAGIAQPGGVTVSGSTSPSVAVAALPPSTSEQSSDLADDDSDAPPPEVPQQQNSASQTASNPVSQVDDTPVDAAANSASDDDDTPPQDNNQQTTGGQNVSQGAITNANVSLPIIPQPGTVNKNFTNVSGDLVQLDVDFQAFQQNGSGDFRATNSTIPLSTTSATGGDLFVTIDAAASGDANTLLADLQALGLQNGTAFGRIVSGRLPVSAINQLNGLASLNFVRPAYAMVNVGLTTSQGDEAQRSDEARSLFGVDGSGFRVGVLSDSYNCLGGAGADKTNDDLPNNINILDDLKGGNCAGAIDEGRAMMQLIHDAAPGAPQSFHTAFNGMADFANGIIQLKNNGADVIVDDVIYFAEPMFQDGIIAQAVDQVVADGVPYFSSAGNNARQSYESVFDPSGSFGFFGELHDFDPDTDPLAVDTMQEVTIPLNSTIIIAMQWDQPFFSTSGAPGSANDIDILLLDSGGSLVFDSFGAPVFSVFSNIGGDPFEFIAFTNVSTLGYGTTFNITIEKFDPGFPTPDPSLIKYVEFRGSMTVNEFDTASATSYGHANAAGAEAVGAAFYVDTPEFGQTPPLLESFSSAGGIPILFDINGNSIAPILRDKPEIVAPDGTNTTFFGGSDPEPDGFPNFFGTSAAAPHAAAVAALMLDGNSGLTPAEVYDALEMTAIDMDAGGFDFDTGYGLIDAVAAVDLTILPAKPVLSAPENKALINDNTPDLSWQAADGAVNYEIEIDDNKDFSSPVQNAIVGSTSHTASTLGDGQYYWRVRGLNTGGIPGEWSKKWRFTVDTTAPDIPILDSPADGATVESNKAQFKWNKNNDVDVYEFRIEPFNPPSGVAGATSKNKFKPPSGLVTGTLYWQVRAIDKAGNASNWSTIRSVVVISPANGAPQLNEFGTATPLLTWNPISWADEYEIQIDIDSKFNSALLQSYLVAAPTLELTTNPLPDGIYQWRIRARETGGAWSKWSKKSSFVVRD